MSKIDDYKKKRETLLNAKNKIGLTLVGSAAVISIIAFSGKSNDNNKTVEDTPSISTEYVSQNNYNTTEIKITEQKTEKVTEYTEKDNIIVTEFIKEREKINDSYENDDKETLGDKAKKYFIKAVDFIFYDGEINGVRYSELKEETKELIYNELCETDEFIMQFAPNYKENIAEKYQLVKDFTSKVYYSSLDKIKELIGEENYEKLGEIKDSLLDKAKELKDKTVDKTKEYTLKLKNWYEEIRDN